MATLKPTMPMDRPIRDFLQPGGLLLRAAWTVDQAIARLRAVSLTPLEQQVLYLYVLDDAERLVGIMSTRKLLLSPGSMALTEIMDRGVISLRDADTLFDACELFAIHRLLAIPVVDAERKYLGTLDVSVYTDEVFDLAERKSSDEMFQLIGFHLKQVRNASALAGYKLRMPWLLANIVGGLACALLGSLFQQTLDRIILLALFIPLMLTLAESVAMQSMTLAVQRITSGAGAGLRYLPRELATAALLGVTAGAVTGNMILAAAIGHLVPKLTARFHLNPSVAPGPVALALTDTVAVTLYLGLAAAIL